jgi:probable F420-dependent oxidoreductase
VSSEAPLRLGCDLPYLADPVEIRDFAQAAEGLGYDSLSFSEHVASTRDSPFPPGFGYDDPWHEAFTVAAFLAGVTSTIELSTSMLLLPLRPTVLAAKQAAEVDLLSGGRLRLGVSVGWNTGEVRALEQDPAARGARLEEQVELMRRLWAEPEVTWRSAHHDLVGVGIHPRPGRRIPIWMGAGNFASGGVPSDRSLDRIARLADGYKMFAPLGFDDAAAVAVVERLRAAAERVGRDPGEIGLEARLLTQAVPRDGWAASVAAWRERGATHVGLGNRIAGGTVDAQIAVIEDVARALQL